MSLKITFNKLRTLFIRDLVHIKHGRKSNATIVCIELSDYYINLFRTVHNFFKEYGSNSSHFSSKIPVSFPYEVKNQNSLFLYNLEACRFTITVRSVVVEIKINMRPINPIDGVPDVIQVFKQINLIFQPDGTILQQDG